MTKNIFRNLTSKLFSVIAMILCIAMLSVCAVGCESSEDETDSSYTDPTVTFQETDDGEISNASFNMGLKDLNDVTFPISSSNNWTRSADNLATASAVNSGVVSTSDSDWTALLDNLNTDSDFVDYLESKGKTKETAKDLFANPSIPQGAGDNYVYMLNNYRTKNYVEFGTAQKVTSSSNIQLDKNEVVKVSVSVKTANIAGSNSKGFGANIRLVNSFNDNSQADFQINNIVCADWTEYSIYVKSDATYSCNFTLILGLGYGNGAAEREDFYTEGTAYFDNVKFEKIEDSSTLPAFVDGTTSKTMVYASKDAAELTASTNTVFLYDMTFNPTTIGSLTVANGKFQGNSANTAYYDYTKSNTALTGNPTNASDACVVTATDSEVKLQLKKASFTVKVDDDGNNFSVAPEKFVTVSFDVTNNLSKFSNTSVTVDLFERVVGTTEFTKRAGIASFTTASEDASNCKIIVKNNFVGGQTREFYLEVVVGPTSVASVTNLSDFASGTVILNNYLIISGDVIKANEDNYDLYSLYTSSPSATVGLYAGYNQDYTETTDDFSFEVAPSDVGTIISAPTTAKGYVGITPNHTYINGESNITAINDRLNGNTAGSYAGLINSKHLGNYADTNLTTALAFNIGDDDIQPLVIYNNVDDQYGFVGASNTVSANAYASVSVKLRVYGANAVAYVYLVNTQTAEKNVLTFDSFGDVKGEDLKFVLKVTPNMMDADGWTTVNFYIGAGDSSKDFRVEVWNGERNKDGAKSTGYVFIDNITISNGSAFTEPSRMDDAFSVEGNPLFEIGKKAFANEGNKLYSYTRELTDTEKEYNEEYPNEAVSYSPTYVWANSEKAVYAIFNTIDPTENDPYANVTEDEEDEGCAAETDPASFWLGFSSILLGVVLVLALIALIVKNIRRRRKANKNDAKAHYNVSSRAKAIKQVKHKKKAKANEEEIENDEEVEDADAVEEIKENSEETLEETIEEEVEEEKAEETLDDYVYGEVENFGELQAEPTDAGESNDADGQETDKE